MDFENNNTPIENTEEKTVTSVVPEAETETAGEAKAEIAAEAPINAESTFKAEAETENKIEAEIMTDAESGLDSDTVTFDAVAKLVEQEHNTGLKVFFSMIAVVVALIIAVSAGYVFGSKQSSGIGTNILGSTATADKNEAEHQYSKTVVYNNVNPSVVGISVCTDGELMGYASGVVYTEDGYIVTNDHIYADVTSPEFLVTLYDGTVLSAEFVAGDTRSDLAVLKIEATGLKKATFGNYSEVTTGEEVITIGYPTGVSSDSILTSGTVSSPAVRFSGSSSYSTKMIQTDAPINPGNSGGALVNMYSQVIGIPSVKLAGTSYDNVGYAIPSDTVTAVADSLIKYGYVEGRGRLGITYQAVDTVTGIITGEPTGLKIASVSDDSDLYGKGINVGDIITHINNTKITGSNIALDIIESTAPGVPMSFTVYHSDTKKSETVYASLLPDQGSSSYTVKVTDESNDNPFGSGDFNDFFSDH